MMKYWSKKIKNQARIDLMYIWKDELDNRMNVEYEEFLE